MNILIVENEDCARKSLAKMAREWKDSQDMTIREAADGKCAFDRIHEQVPDLVLTDVRMPNIDGLELASLIQKHYPQCNVGIISGYGEFEYAKRAMEYGVSSYILKPVKQEELYKVLKQTMDSMKALKLQNARLDMKNRLYQWITRPSMRCIDEHDHALNMSLKRYTLMVIYEDLSPNGLKQKKEINAGILTTLASENPCCELIKTDKTMNTLLLRHNKGEGECMSVEKVLSILDKSSKGHYAGISSEHQGLSELHTAYKEAMLSLKYKAIDRDHVHYYETVKKREKYVSIFGHREAVLLKLYLEQGMMHRTYEMIEHVMVNTAGHKDISIYSVEDMGNKINIVLNEITSGILTGSQSALPVKLSRFNRTFNMMEYNSVEEIIQSFREKIERFGKIIDYQKSENKSSTDVIIKFVLEYIRNNYDKDISLKQLAENIFFLNSSYLSHLLKDKTGKNYTDHLTEARMENARALLSDKALSVTSVAGLCGYNDTSQFIRIFKRKYNMTPGQFQEKVRGPINE